MGKLLALLLGLLDLIAASYWYVANVVCLIVAAKAGTALSVFLALLALGIAIPILGSVLGYF